ncbi:MAG: YMGG-like glycine zipper-containing protein [Verrucomicrobiales bacterium]
MNLPTKRNLSIMILATAAGFVSCTQEEAQMAQTTTRGAAFGGAAGAVVGNQFGAKGKGAAVGAVTGAVVGNTRTYHEQQREKQREHALRLAREQQEHELRMKHGGWRYQ